MKNITQIKVKIRFYLKLVIPDKRRAKFDGGVVSLRRNTPNNRSEKSLSPIMNGTRVGRLVNKTQLRNKNVVKIQRWFRKCIPIKRMKDYYVTKIQSFWLGHNLREKISKIFKVYFIV